VGVVVRAGAVWGGGGGGGAKAAHYCYFKIK